MQDQTDIAAQHDTRSAVDRLLRENSRLRADCEAAQAEARQTEQTLASLRGLVRSALVELDERARANAEATVTLADVRAQAFFRQGGGGVYLRKTEEKAVEIGYYKAA